MSTSGYIVGLLLGYTLGWFHSKGDSVGSYLLRVWTRSTNSPTPKEHAAPIRAGEKGERDGR